MAFNVAKIASARASLTISLTKSLRVAGPLLIGRFLQYFRLVGEIVVTGVGCYRGILGKTIILMAKSPTAVLY